MKEATGLDRPQLQGRPSGRAPKAPVRSLKAACMLSLAAPEGTPVTSLPPPSPFGFVIVISFVLRCRRGLAAEKAGVGGRELKALSSIRREQLSSTSVQLSCKTKPTITKQQPTLPSRATQPHLPLYERTTMVPVST